MKVRGEEKRQDEPGGLHVGKDLICLCLPIAVLSINFSHLIRCFNHNTKEAYLNSFG